jgi:hypothetical protein
VQLTGKAYNTALSRTPDSTLLINGQLFLSFRTCVRALPQLKWAAVIQRTSHKSLGVD